MTLCLFVRLLSVNWVQSALGHSFFISLNRPQSLINDAQHYALEDGQDDTQDGA